MKPNKINVFLETGCTKQNPKVFNTRWVIAQNNGAKQKINEQYIHNGKGTAIIKNKKI